jgi:hypothetical protein
MDLALAALAALVCAQTTASAEELVRFDSAQYRVGQIQQTRWGYLSLAVDSFATRGIKDSCDRLLPSGQADALGRCSIFPSSLLSTPTGLPLSDRRGAASSPCR